MCTTTHICMYVCKCQQMIRWLVLTGLLGGISNSIVIHSGIKNDEWHNISRLEKTDLDYSQLTHYKIKQRPKGTAGTAN